MNTVSSTANIEHEGTPEAAFYAIVPIDLSTIFTGYGLLPAVIGVKDQRGVWDGAGQSRTVLFSDGSAAKETLTTYEAPHHFAYTIDDFTGVLRYLARGAVGAWWFEGKGSRTAITWRYTFIARSRVAFPVLWLLVNILWRRYMLKALHLAAAQPAPRAG